MVHGPQQRPGAGEPPQTAERSGAYPVVEFNAAAAEEFGRIKSEQRRSGKSIPPIDAQIAAIARVHSLVILTADKHFDFIDGITVENWLA